jgi:hypothetical protein
MGTPPECNRKSRAPKYYALRPALNTACEVTREKCARPDVGVSFTHANGRETERGWTQNDRDVRLGASARSWV